MGAIAEVLSNVLLFFLVFGMSATVDIDKLRKQLGNRYALMTGVSLQFLILPFVGFCVVRVFNFPAPVGITLLVVTSSPGGSYSNWWCSLFNAELALSVTMTALSTMLAAIMLPVNLLVYATGSYSGAVVKSLDWSALFMSIFVVIGGISSGLFCSAYFKDCPDQSHQIHKHANRFGNVAGISLISFSILVSSSDHKAALWDQSWQFFVGLAIPALIGITIATGMATWLDLEKPERVAVAVESCYQNTALATSVAVVMFGNTGNEDDLATALSVTLYYGMVEALLLATFCLICWKIGWTKAPSDEALCVILATSYEVETQEAVAHAASIGVVLGDISHSEDKTGHQKELEIGVVTKPPLIFVVHADDSGDNVSNGEGSGAVILRRADHDGAIATAESDCLNTREREVMMEEGISSANRLSFRSHEPLPSCDSLTEDGEHVDQQMDGSGRDNKAKQTGRLGKTIAFVKARATGYRRAPVPIDDGCEIAPSPAREPPTGMATSGELPDRGGLCEEHARSSEGTPQAENDFPGSASLATSIQDDDSTDATHAEGKTID